VIGNGDVRNKKKAVEMIERTGSDLVMIGRRAMGDPGFFRRCINEHKHEEGKVPSSLELFHRFMKYYNKYDNDKSFSELRTHALWFSKRAGLGPKARNLIMRSKNKKTLEQVFHGL